MLPGGVLVLWNNPDNLGPTPAATGLAGVVIGAELLTGGPKCPVSHLPPRILWGVGDARATETVVTAAGTSCTVGNPIAFCTPIHPV
jgi:hypothetical protein